MGLPAVAEGLDPVGEEIPAVEDGDSRIPDSGQVLSDTLGQSRI